MEAGCIILPRGWFLSLTLFVGACLLSPAWRSRLGLVMVNSIIFLKVAPPWHGFVSYVFQRCASQFSPPRDTLSKKRNIGCLSNATKARQLPKMPIDPNIPDPFHQSVPPAACLHAHAPQTVAPCGLFFSDTVQSVFPEAADGINHY